MMLLHSRIDVKLQMSGWRRWARLRVVLLWSGDLNGSAWPRLCTASELGLILEAELHKHLFVRVVQWVELVVIVHAGFAVKLLMLWVGIQVISELFHALAREDTEDISLMLVELSRCLTAECEKIISQERLHTCKTQMSELRAVVQKSVDAVKTEVDAIAEMYTLQ